MCRTATSGVEPKTKFYLFHQWSKWEPYVESGTAMALWGGTAGQRYQYSENRQNRKCNRCGKTQDELI